MSRNFIYSQWIQLGTVAVTYRISYRRLQWCVLFLLAADVVKGKENVVVVRQGGRQLNLDLIMKVWGSVHTN